MLMVCTVDGAAGLGDAVDPDGWGRSTRPRPADLCHLPLLRLRAGNLVPNHGGSLPYLCGCSHECPGRRQPGAGEQESSTEAPPKKK